jgi:hypothetical protein
MAFTGVLGTAASRGGNFVLGVVPAPTVANHPVQTVGVRRQTVTTVGATFRRRTLPPWDAPVSAVDALGWLRRPQREEEPIREEAAVKRKPWLPGPVWWPQRRTPGADEPAAPEPLPRRFGWPSPNLGGEWVVRPRRAFPEPQAWEQPPKPPMGWLPFAPPPPAACPYRPVRPDAGQALAGRPDEGQSLAGRPDEGGSRPGRPDESQARAGRPDEGGSRSNRPDECR